MSRLSGSGPRSFAFAILLAVLMTFGIAACGSDSDDDAATEEAATTATDEDADEDAAGQEDDAATDEDAAGQEDDAATDEDAAGQEDADDEDAMAEGEDEDEGADPADAEAEDAAGQEDAGAEAAGNEVTLVEWAVEAPTSYPAGEVSFVAGNNGEFPHELAIARGDSYDSLPQTTTGAVDEDALGADVLGRTERISPGQSATLTVDLEPGNYVIFCNLGSGPSSHAANGQVLSITVEG